MTANGSALLCYVMIISVQKLTHMIKSNTAVFLKIQSHNSKILKRILKRSLKQTRIVLVKTCELSFVDFKNGDKNIKTFLKGEQVLLPLRKFYWKTGRKLIISYSNKTQSGLLKASKVQQPIPAGSLKK